jgi:uncharacterized protein YndB with AHSA1/START domain
MSEIRTHALADVIDGLIVASVEIARTPERVFQALITREIIEWWVNPGVFDTREWTGDVRVGGRWKASGIARGAPYTLGGEFLEVDPPRKLVQTWSRIGMPGDPSVLTYLLEPIAGGTRLTVRHAGIVAPEQRNNMSAGWRTSCDRLAEILPTQKR